MVTLDIAVEGTDITPLRDVWEAVYRGSASEPSTSYEWTAAMLRHHLRDGDKILVLRLSRDAETLGLVPLVARTTKVFSVPLVTLAPISELYNTHSDILAARFEDELIEAFVNGLSRLGIAWDLFRLATLLETHPLARWMERGAGLNRRSVQLRDGHASYFMTLPASWEGYLGQRSAKFRSHLKRAQKRLEKEPGVAVVEASTPPAVESGYEMLLHVERASWKHAHGTAISAIARQTGFYRDLCVGAAAHGRLRLQFLTIAGEPVAYNLGYVRNGVYYYLKTSYAERCKPLHVATCLRASLVRSLIDEGLQHMDFPAEPYEWERQWTEQVRWHKVVSMYRGTAAGCALALTDSVRGRFVSGRTLEYANARAHRGEGT